MQEEVKFEQAEATTILGRVMSTDKLMKSAAVIISIAASGCATQPDKLDPGSPAESYTIETTDSNFKIVSLTSVPRDVNYSMEQIISRAGACVGRTFSFSQVGTAGANRLASIGGGQLIELSDPTHGVLVANNRVNFTSAMIPYSAQGKYTVEAKERKFRIVIANPEMVQRSTGYLSPDTTFKPIHKIWGTHWSDAVSQLADSANKLASCIEAPNSNW